MNTDRLLWKLLRAGLSVPQLVGYALSALLGLVIVMIAVQAYCDLRPAFDDDGELLGGSDYLIVTRSVNSAGALLGDDGSFGDNDVESLMSQPWCRDIGEFRGSDYPIEATIAVGTGGRGLRTGFFFEAVDDRFLDVDLTAWHFDTVNPVVPVIIPRDYLSLYNFGYAASHGLPRVSYGQAAMLPLRFHIGGAGGVDLPGRIVGFSGRLNTVVVPMSFMQWASERYGSGGKTQPSRLMVEVANPSDPQVANYMSEHRLEVAGDKMGGNNGAAVLAAVTAIVVLIGVVICVMALMVLVLSVHLLMQRNATRISRLMQLGYTPMMVARPYERLVLAVSAAVLVLAIAMSCAARAWYAPLLQQLGIAGESTVVWSITAGVALIAVLTAWNFIAIRRRVKDLF